MLIKTKNIDCASKSVFNTWKLPTGAADTSGDIYWSAVVYIKDTGEVWTHGKLYGGFFSNADSNKVSLTIGGTQKVLALDGHVQSYTTLTGSGTTADQVILSTGVANKWTLKTLGKNAFSNVDYLPIDGTAVAAEKVVNAMKFKYNGKDILSFDGSVARALNLIQGDNVFISGDSQGNVTIAADPGSDTVNTAGATNLTNKKLFLIGAESQTTSPQTYSNQYVYVGTDNCLYSLGEKVLTKHQTIYNLDLQTLINNVTTKVTTFDPNAANNSFTLAQGTNITLTPDATNKKVTISSKDTTYDFYNLIFKQGESVIDTYKPTTSPSKSLKAGTNVAFTKSGDEVTVTAIDTRNTTGATERLATKLFLTGALTQTDNPQTYTNSKVYVGTDNKLYSDGKVVSTGDHTHNYAGATNPGGPALKIDLNPGGLLAATYGAYAGILQDSNNGPVAGAWSNRIKILHNNSTGYYTEIAQNFTGTAGLWHRRDVEGALGEWIPVIDKMNFRTYLDDTYVVRGDSPSVLSNYVKYSIASGLTMNWEMGNATPTHIWGAKANDSSKAYTFNGDNIRAFANAVNKAGDTMTGTLKVTEIQATNGNGLVMYSGTTYTYLGMQAGTTYIRSGATDLQHRYNGTDYNIWDARNLVGLRTEHSHNTINHIDNRDTASTPQEHPAGLWLDFKANAKAGLTDGGTYTGLLTVRKYGSTSDWSGGKAAQLGFTDNSNVWVRSGTGTAWEAWKQLATTGWADGKFLPLTGGTMTGNITISTDSIIQWSRNTDYAKIHFKNTGDGDADSYMGFETGDNGNEYFKFSGNSGGTITQWMSIKSNGVTAPAFIKSGSSAAYVLLGDGGHKALNQFIYSTYGSCGVNERTGNSDDLGRAGFWRDNNLSAYGVTLMHSGTADYQCKIYHDYGTGGNLYMKSRANGTWGSVYTIWNSANFDPNTKVNKAGDTMTGDLLFAQPSVTGIRQIRMTCGDNDFGRIATGATATNAGWMEIATADDGTEPIYARQYTGVFSAIKRTATLLDGSGNTYFPGTVYSNNVKLLRTDEINSQVGGSKSAQMLWNSWSTDTLYGGAIQIREYGNVAGTQSAWGYSPALTFHWGNRYAKRFGMRSDGLFAVDNVPISLNTHNHDGTYAWQMASLPSTGRVGYSGFYQSSEGGTSGNRPFSGWMHLINCQHSNSDNNYALQIAGGFYDNINFKIRETNNNGSATWNTLWHSGNLDPIQTTYSFVTGSGNSTSDFQTWVTAMYSSGGYKGKASITTGSWWWAGALSFVMPGSIGSINPSGAMVIYSGEGGNSKNYKHFLVLDAYANLYGVTSNEESWKYYAKFVKTTDKIANASYADDSDKVDGYHASAFSFKSWWHWSGQGGQPTWLWGGNAENNYYVYNPSNFNVNSAQYAHKVRGEYTGGGGQLGPSTLGRNYVGFRMMNTTVGTNGSYKDWIISDCYSGTDVGGAVAFGMNRQALGAYLMGSDSSRASWSRKGEFWGTWNLDPVNKTLLKKTRVPGEVVDFYVYRVGSYYCTNTDYTTFKNQLFNSDGRGKPSVTYYPTYSSTTYTVDLSDFILCYGNMAGYANGAYMAGAGEVEANRVGYSAGANSKTISGYQMPRHTHWFAYHRGDNANDRDHFGPNSAQGDSPNGITAAGQGGNWHSGYSGRGDAIDFRPRTVFVFKMIYAPKTW